MAEQVADETTLAQVRVDIAGLTGRMDQVILDHRARIDKNEIEIAQEKRDRIAEVRRLENSFVDFEKRAEASHAGLKANVIDLQNDSKEFRERQLGAPGKVVAVVISPLIAASALAFSVIERVMQR